MAPLNYLYLTSFAEFRLDGDAVPLLKMLIDLFDLIANVQLGSLDKVGVVQDGPAVASIMVLLLDVLQEIHVSFQLLI